MKTMPAAEPITAAFFDAAYFGCDPDRPPKSNYDRYGPASKPSWALPLARWLAGHAQPPVLELGAAYGHLVRTLSDLGCPAWGIDWSPWATGNAVSPRVIRADARHLVATFPRGRFGAVVSLDFLEHLTPADGTSVMAQAVSRLAPGGRMFHLVGTPQADGHYDDASHQNHAPLQFYIDHLEALGMRFDKTTTHALNAHPAWSDTDWSGRWTAFIDGRDNARDP